ncbi:MAG: beta strand repeat-containing protein [Acidimicrobiales bacterium]
MKPEAKVRIPGATALKTALYGKAQLESAGHHKTSLISEVLVKPETRPGSGLRSGTRSRKPRMGMLSSVVIAVSAINLALPAFQSLPAYAASGAVSAPAVTITSYSAGASQVTYRVSFTVSSSGGMQGGSGTIALIGPAGTNWPATASNYVIGDSTTATGSGIASQVGVADNGMVAVITVPNNINNSDSITVKVLGTTNPVTSGTYTIGVETSSDPALVQSSPYTITSATSVSNPTVTLSTTSANATGVTYYTDFSTSSAGRLAGQQGTITLTAPQGTAWSPACQGSSYNITDNTNPSEGGTPTACQVIGSTVILTVPNTIYASDSLSVTANNVTNPPSGFNDTIGISTSSDVSLTKTSAYTTQPFTSVSGLKVVPSTTVAGAHGVSYEVWFGVSGEGELMAKEGTISMSFPGAWWPTSGDPSSSTAYTIVDWASAIKTYSTVGGSSIGPQDGESGGITIVVPFTIQAGNEIEVVITGMINPPNAGTATFSMSTSSDQAAVSTPVSLVAPSAVTNVSSTASSTGYDITFTTSSTGTLIPNQGTITIVSSVALVGPTYCITDTTNNEVYAYSVLSPSGGTAYPPNANLTVTTLSVGTAIGQPNPSNGFCATSGGAPSPIPNIAAGDTVQIGIETSAAPASTPTFSIETSSDTLEVQPLQPPSATSNAPSVTLTPTYGAGAFATYTISFTAANTLYGQTTTDPSAIQLIFPRGTILTDCQNSIRIEFSSYCPPVSFSITDSTTSGGSGTGSIPSLGGNDTVALIPVPNTIDAGDNVSISIGSIQNPPAGTYSIGMSTFNPLLKTQPAYLGTQSYTIEAASSVTTPTVSLSTTAANATGVTYAISFAVSSQGSLLGATNLMAQASTIALTATAGTIWPTNQADYSFIDHTASSPVTPLGGLGLSVSVSNNGSSVGQIVLPRLVVKNDSLTVIISGVTNPPAGSNTLSVSTSSDTVPAISTPYTTVTPTAMSIASVKVSSQIARALGVTYGLAATTSSTGSLTDGQGRIYISAGNGSVLPSSASSYNIVDNTTPSGTGKAANVTAFGSNAVITVNNTIASGDFISLSISGAANPPTTGADPITIWTSSDLIPTTYSSLSMTQATSPANPNMYMSSSNVDQSGVTYTIDFNTSSSGALGADASSITLVAPPDTNFSSANIIATDDTSGQSLGPMSSVKLSGGFSMITLYVASDVAPSSTVTITISSVTNPPTMGKFILSTSTDTTPVTVSMPTVSAPTVTGVSPNSGSTIGGYNVIIGGTNLELTTEVSFGGAAANFTIFSPTSLIAIPPNGAAGMVDVTATNPIGTSVTSPADKFTYVQGSKPTSPADYVPISPVRLADTRCAEIPKPSFCAAEKLPSQNAALTAIDSQRNVNITVVGVDNIPSSGTTAVALNVTLVGPTVRSGYLSVYPASSSGGQPTVSNINWGAIGADIPNLATVAVGQNGQVTIYNGSAGTINVTVDIEGYFSTSALAGNSYNPVSPLRLADTRCAEIPKPSFCAAEKLPSQNAALKMLAPLAQENVVVAGISNIPSGVAAVVLNVTVTNTNSSGYLTVWPEGQPKAVVSNLNWASGKAVANRVVVPVGTGGGISVFNGAGKGSANFIVDISGYYTSTGTLFSAVSPMRICDTRSTTVTGYTTECSTRGALPPGQTLSVQVTGVDGIPSSGLSAVVANVTAAGSTSGGGYLSVLPGGTSVSSSSPPSISDLNWGAPEQDVANLVVVKLGSGGTIEIYNSSGSTNVIIDVMGWYS